MAAESDTYAKRMNAYIRKHYNDAMFAHYLAIKKNKLNALHILVRQNINPTNSRLFGKEGVNESATKQLQLEDIASERAYKVLSGTLDTMTEKNRTAAIRKHARDLRTRRDILSKNTEVNPLRSIAHTVKLYGPSLARRREKTRAGITGPSKSHRNTLRIHSNLSQYHNRRNRTVLFGKNKVRLFKRGSIVSNPKNGWFTRFRKKYLL